MAALQYYDILLTPVVTEKSMKLMTEKKYVFKVHVDTNKDQIKYAVEKMFPGTKVLSVNVLNYDGKKRRRGKITGKTSSYKKAVVKLAEESKEIEIFSNL